MIPLGFIRFLFCDEWFERYPAPTRRLIYKLILGACVVFHSFLISWYKRCRCRRRPKTCPPLCIQHPPTSNGIKHKDPAGADADPKMCACIHLAPTHEHVLNQGCVIRRIRIIRRIVFNAYSNTAYSYNTPYWTS
jgi:hypothetical protein